MNKKKYTSLQLSKELAEAAKEAGVKLPKSEYWWVAVCAKQAELMERRGENDPQCQNLYPAYDTRELMDILEIKEFSLDDLARLAIMKLQKS